MNPITTVRPDSKNRITLGKIAEGVSKYDVIQGEDATIILKPYVEMSAEDLWHLKMYKEAIEDDPTGEHDVEITDFSDEGLRKALCE